jgi:saccharopine dehydrogenase-like NADP-dependent oxidoreductase
MSSADFQSPETPFRILLIGASGNFGARLAHLLIQERAFGIVLAGRRRAALDALIAEIGEGEAIVLDRETIDADTLGSLDVDLVIDASGPFQTMNTNVIEAAIGARAHYIDLADSRGFVANVALFDDAARQAGVSIVSGASSTPALSNAVVDHLVAGWRRIDTIEVAISPSNRQPRGRAVIEAILSGVGHPHTVFRDGRWGKAFGWGGLRQMNFPGVGNRWASHCDVPDCDLLARRFRARVSAEFFASLELSVMHIGLWALGGMVRAGLISALTPMTATLGWLADRLQRFGNDIGGMVVRVKGQDAHGAPSHREWWLAAKGEIGPNVPVLAALALARKHRDAAPIDKGAKPCVGILALSDFNPDFSALEMTTGQIEIAIPTPIFETALGAAYASLPRTTQALHRPNPAAVWRGEGTAEGGSNRAARSIARAFRLPKPVRNVPLHVIIDQQADGSERWARAWPDGVMRSIMCHPGAGDGHIEEHFGPFAFRLALKGHADGIDMILISGRLFGIPLPGFVLPGIAATERADGKRHLFDVRVALPLVGQLVRYHGWLAA